MKAKQIKQSIFAILMIAVLMVGTSVVGVGAATQKTYLDTMGYSYFDDGGCSNNSCAPFNGEDKHNIQCTNAYQFFIDTYSKSYSNMEEVENRGYVSYTVSFDLNKKYDEFNFYLTSGKHIFTDGTRITIFGDDKVLYGNGVTEETNQVPVNINVLNVDKITFEIRSAAVGGSGANAAWIILNDAYFTSEGTAPEPTEKPTQKPTVSPDTNPVINPTVAPTTAKPAVTPTKDVEDTTTATKTTTISEEATSTKIHPTASTNPTSKISTTDTATKDSANKGTAAISNNKGNSDNGTIQTGAISIAVVLFVILASLATGGFVWYRRKIK